MPSSGVWDAKYAYGYWRPVTAIRDGNADGNLDTVGDPTWTPLLVTPNHPSYVSAHSGFTGAAAVALASFFGTDNISFSLGSPTAPGVIKSFDSFSAAAQDVGQSRIYAGIHWPWDIQNGLTLGEQVGSYVVSNFFQPASKTHEGDAHAVLGSGAPGGESTMAPGHSPGLFAVQAASEATSARSPGAAPQGVGALDPTWWASPSQATGLAPIPSVTQAIDLAMADLGGALPRRSHARTT